MWILQFFVFVKEPPPPPIGPGSPDSRGFWITHNDASQSVGHLQPNNQLEQRPLPDDKRHSQQKDIHNPGGDNVSSLINTFAASYLNTQGLNNSCLKSPASTLVDLTFQSWALRSFSLNQLRNLSLQAGNLHSSFSISS